jgi:glutathione S-transferase
VFAGLMFADAAGIAIPEDHSALKAWRARVSELPSVKNRSGQMFVAEDQRRLGF